MQRIVIGVLIGMCFMLAAMVRYPVGQAVPAEVYTAPFDASDGLYKFFQTDFGEPNSPGKPHVAKLQAAPDEWIKQFGNNERTALFHTISELRVVVANQSRRIMALEARDPNGLK
jgi:hypothetical protein